MDLVELVGIETIKNWIKMKEEQKKELQYIVDWIKKEGEEKFIANMEQQIKDIDIIIKKNKTAIMADNNSTKVVHKKTGESHNERS